ncbi:MAG: hypothetical protein AB3N20_13550 [Rhizobiaceae bacterium]
MLTIAVLCLGWTGSRAADLEQPVLPPTPDQAAESKPAVDGINATLSLEVGIDGADVVGGTGSVTFPLGHQFGLQFDASAARFDNDIVGVVPVFRGATHLFWRDPSMGMLGVFGDYFHVDLGGGFNFFAGGIEGALYFNQITVDGFIGVEGGDTVDSGFFNRARLAYYPTEDLVFHIGHAYALEEHRLLYGGEWGFARHGGAASSMFVEGELDEGGDTSMLAGLRFYFGQREKPLIRRHREDDPAALTASSDDENYDFLVKFLLLGPSGVGDH